MKKQKEKQIILIVVGVLLFVFCLVNWFQNLKVQTQITELENKVTENFEQVGQLLFVPTNNNETIPVSNAILFLDQKINQLYGNNQNNIIGDASISGEGTSTESL